MNRNNRNNRDKTDILNKINKLNNANIINKGINRSKIKTKNNKNEKYTVNKIFIMIFIIVCLSLIVLFIFFRNNTSKNFKFGNNTNSQEIVDYILNINSYEALMEVNVKSNKNENKYKLKQTYKGKQENSQEVIEPENISGVKIIKEGSNLKIENSKLNLTSILQNYEYISENALDLSCFIDNYKSDNNSNYEEKDNKIIMKTLNKSLYINKENGKIEKMEILDDNKKLAVYILYNEVNVNS